MSWVRSAILRQGSLHSCLALSPGSLLEKFSLKRLFHQSLLRTGFFWVVLTVLQTTLTGPHAWPTSPSPRQVSTLKLIRSSSPTQTGWSVPAAPPPCGLPILSDTVLYKAVSTGSHWASPRGLNVVGLAPNFAGPGGSLSFPSESREIDSFPAQPLARLSWASLTSNTQHGGQKSFQTYLGFPKNS